MLAMLTTAIDGGGYNCSGRWWRRAATAAAVGDDGCDNDGGRGGEGDDGGGPRGLCGGRLRKEEAMAAEGGHSGDSDKAGLGSRWRRAAVDVGARMVTVGVGARMAAVAVEMAVVRPRW